MIAAMVINLLVAWLVLSVLTAVVCAAVLRSGVDEDLRARRGSMPDHARNRASGRPSTGRPEDGDLPGHVHGDVRSSSGVRSLVRHGAED